jgi:hypothetical protein
VYEVEPEQIILDHLASVGLEADDLERLSEAKILCKGKTIDKSKPFSAYPALAISLILVIAPKSNKPVQVPQPKTEEPKPELTQKPILEQVQSSDLDQEALGTLMMMGVDKDLAMLALKRVGTEYGSLGYDGVNKALDMVDKIKIERVKKALEATIKKESSTEVNEKSEKVR